MIDPALNAAVKFGKADGSWEPAKIGAARYARVFAANTANSDQWFR
jgi:hypothetical protein